MNVDTTNEASIYSVAVAKIKFAPRSRRAFCRRDGMYSYTADPRLYSPDRWRNCAIAESLKKRDPHAHKSSIEICRRMRRGYAVGQLVPAPALVHHIIDLKILLGILNGCLDGFAVDECFIHFLKLGCIGILVRRQHCASLDLPVLVRLLYLNINGQPFDVWTVVL